MANTHLFGLPRGPIRTPIKTRRPPENPAIFEHPVRAIERLTRGNVTLVLNGLSGLGYTTTKHHSRNIRMLLGSLPKPVLHKLYFHLRDA